MSERRTGDPGSQEPEVDSAPLEGLFRVLKAAPSPSEMAGAEAVLAAFRAMHAGQARAKATEPGPTAELEPTAEPGPTAEPRRPPEPGWQQREEGGSGQRRAGGRRRVPFGAGWRLRVGVAAAAALPIALLIGAAYAQALPAPVQRAAYQVLGFAGVPSPGSHPAGPAGASARAGSHARTSRAGSPSPPSASTGQSTTGRPPGAGPSPGASTPSAPVAITLAISSRQDQVEADASAVLSVRATSGGRPAAGISLSLEERPAGQSAWSAAGTAVTSSDGVAVVQTALLTSNTTFRFTDGHGGVSASVTVTVVLPVTLTLISAHGKGHVAVSVSAPLAATGDQVIVQVMTSGAWQNVSIRQIGRRGDPVIVRMSRRFAGSQLRAVLPATAAHATSVSNLLIVPSG